MDETAQLARRLVERIRTEGPITFAAFMEAALYDEVGGFYARLPVGEARDFVTSPHVSPIFGELLAAQLHECWRLLGEPAPFEVVELGAGDGTLATQITAGLPLGMTTVRYTGVDRSAAARNALREREIRTASSLEEVSSLRAGCVVANELLDNVPAHWVRRGPKGELRERYVGLGPGDSLELVDGLPSTPALELEAAGLPPGNDALVRPATVELLAGIDRVLGRGYAWIFDYGFTGGETATGPHGYRAHRIEADVLTDPGSRDITAGVDFDALGRQARSLGMIVWGPVTQRQALLALGWDDRDRVAREGQVAAIGDRRGVEALRRYSDRARASQLINPAGLGGFLVLCLGMRVDPERVPRAMRVDDR